MELVMRKSFFYHGVAAQAPGLGNDSYVTNSVKLEGKAKNICWNKLRLERPNAERFVVPGRFIRRMN